MIRAYAAPAADIALTAANRANICTFAFTGAAPTAQPAFLGDSRGDSAALLCGPCSRLAGSLGGPAGTRVFVCAAGQRDAAELQAGDGGPGSSSARLGARVRLDTKTRCEQAVATWTAEEQRLQPATAHPPRAPTESLEVKHCLTVRLYKNGVFDERQSAEVLLPASANPDVLLETVLREGTSKCCGMHTYFHTQWS